MEQDKQFDKFSKALERTHIKPIKLLYDFSMYNEYIGACGVGYLFGRYKIKSGSKAFYDKSKEDGLMELLCDNVSCQMVEYWDCVDKMIIDWGSFAETLNIFTGKIDSIRDNPDYFYKNGNPKIRKIREHMSRHLDELLRCSLESRKLAVNANPPD